jgi:hypothetical protein
MKEVPHGLAIGEIAHAGSLAVGVQGHRRPFFCMLLAGAYEERVGARRFGFTPASVAYHPPGLEHSDEVGPGGARLFGVRLGPAFLERLRGEAVPAHVVFDTRGDLAWLGRQLHREWTRPDGRSRLALECVQAHDGVYARRVPPRARRGAPGAASLTVRTCRTPRRRAAR